MWNKMFTKDKKKSAGAHTLEHGVTYIHTQTFTHTHTHHTHTDMHKHTNKSSYLGKGCEQSFPA